MILTKMCCILPCALFPLQEEWDGNYGEYTNLNTTTIVSCSIIIITKSGEDKSSPLHLLKVIHDIKLGPRLRLDFFKSNPRGKLSQDQLSRVPVYIKDALSRRNGGSACFLRAPQAGLAKSKSRYVRDL